MVNLQHKEYLCNQVLCMKTVKNGLFLLASVLLCSSVFAQNVGKLERYLQKGTLEEVVTQGFAKKELTRESALAVENVLFEAWEKEVRKRYHRSWVSKCFNRDSLQMKFDYRVFGEQPVDGRSLFISMHGGGNAPEALNTQQWAEPDSFIPAQRRGLRGSKGSLG